MAKCYISDCMMEANRVLCVKAGPVESFIDEAQTELDVTTQDMLSDDSLRRSVLHLAHLKAFRFQEDKACCVRHIPDVTEVVRSKEGATVVIQVFPYRGKLNGQSV